MRAPGSTFPGRDRRRGRASRSGRIGRSCGRVVAGDRMPMGAVSSGRPERRRRPGGDGLLPRPAGSRPHRIDGAFLWDGPAALVPLPVGDRRVVGPRHATRSEGFLPVAADQRTARSSALALGAVIGAIAELGEAVRSLGAGAQRDGAALLLRLSPGHRHRAHAGQPVPAGQIASQRPGERAPQPDGAAPQGADRSLPAPCPEAHSAQYPG